MEPTIKDNIAPLINAVFSLFNPLVDVIDNPDGAAHLLKELGYLPPAEVLVFDDFKPILSSLLNLIDLTEDAIDNNAEPDYVSLIIDIIQGLQGAIQFVNHTGILIQNSFSGSFLTDTNIVQKLPRQLFDYLVFKMLEKEFPVVHASLLLTGIIEQTFVPDAPTSSHTPYTSREIKWEKMGDFITKPIDSLKATYHWDTDDIEFNKLIRNLNRLGHSLRFHSEVTNPVPATLQIFNNRIDVVTSANEDTLRILKFPLLPFLTDAIGGEVYPVLNASKDKVEGLGLGIFFNPGSGLTFSITDNITLKLNYTGNSQLDAGLIIKKNEPVKTIFNVFGNGTGGSINLSDFIPEFIYNKKDSKTIIFATSFGAKLEFKSWAIRAGVKGDEAIFLETDIQAITLLLGGGKGDGFLQKILPKEPIKMSFDVAVGFSTKTGLYFNGSTALEIRFPTNIEIGPISIKGLTLSVSPAQDKIPVGLGADISASLGPLLAVVQNMGVVASFSFPADRKGNLGPAQMDLNFKFPSAIGLTLDTSAVKAGGFLSIKPDEYIGALELEIKAIKLAIKAIAIINTKLPGGEPGFSLLVIITAEFSPITLVFGFTLNGLGGLFGYKRAFESGELRLGLKTKALDSILFPKNVIANITKIVGDLKKVFPMGNNFLIGPMVKIGWGASLVTAEIGILIQVPDPVVIAILGIVRLQLPEPKDAVLKLQINFLGIIDFEKKLFSLDASLTDSRILTMTITGEFALRIGWGSPAVFIFSSGGFHPDFKEAPVELQHMERLGIIIINEADLKLGVGTYFALTTNTVQIGAHARFWAKYGSYTALAEVGFDALIQFNPFFFSIAIYLTGRVTGPMIDIVIEVKGNLSGPNPWHVWGHAYAKLLMFEISIPFDKTFGEPIEELSAGSEDVLQLLKDEIPKNTNWKTTTTVNGVSKVSLREITPGDSNMIVHPNTVLSFNQRVVPLDVTIQNFGKKGIDGPHDFSISANIPNSTVTFSYKTLYDSFAPGNFFEIDQNQKLSRPSFEQMKSGKEITLGSFAAVAANAVSKEIDYEIIYIRKKKTENAVAITLFNADAIVFLASGGAGAKSNLSLENTLVSFQAPPVITINRPSYIIASRADQEVAKDISGTKTQTFDNQTEAYNKRRELDENDTLILSTQEI